MAEFAFICSLCVLALCTGLGVLAPGLSRRFPERTFIALLVTGLSLAGVSLVLSLLELIDWAVLAGSGVPSLLLLCLWLTRWAPRDEDERGYGGDDDLEPLGPIDWDRFDRERARWQRTRHRVA